MRSRTDVRQTRNGYRAALSVACGLLLFLASAAAAQIATDGSQEEPARHSTGALRTPEDVLSALPAVPGRRAFLPEQVDLSNRFPTPGNQGSYGSCVAWAVGYAARSYYSAQPGIGRSLSTNEIASPAYIYQSLTGGRCGPEIGVNPKAALDLLNHKGSMSLADFPYSDKRCLNPTDAHRAAATGFRIKGYLRAGSGANAELALNRVRQELAFGHPAIVSVQVTSTLHDGRTVWRGDGKEETNTGHMVTLTGYDDRKKQLKFINSWSAKWGRGGYGYMTYDAFKKRLWEAYVMRMPFEPVPPKPLPTPKPDDLGIELPDMDCGGVIVEREGGHFKLTGFAGRQEDVDAIRRAVAGRDDVTVDVELRPWPQCETLLTLRDVLSDKRKPEISFPRHTYRVGETLEFGVTMADYQGYLHVAYVQADGNVVNLVQSSPATLKTLSPREDLRFGDGKDGRAKFTVSDPIGNEMVVIVASKSPLFEEKRPTVEPERDFLSALRDAIIARPDAASPERLVTADYFTLTTIGE